MNVRTPELPAAYGQVSFLVQPICDDIKGYAFFSMLSDGLIQEKLVFRIMVAEKTRRTISDREIEG